MTQDAPPTAPPTAPPPADLAIDLRDVTKVYKGRVHALQGIEMRVRRGEVFGLLGPNGAGKSTLVKIMLSVVRPTRARGTVLGRPIGHKATLGRVGYLPENHRFPRYLTGRQVLDFFGALARVDRPTRRRRVPELLEAVGMADAADRKIGAYSKGMMQRVGLAQALINEPDLVVLDEPTDGVDPAGRRDIRNVLSRLREQGKSVFINSHLLSELEMVCDRVAILVGGRVARQGAIDDLTVAQQRYEIEVSAALPPPMPSPVPGVLPVVLPERERILAALPGCFQEAMAHPPPAALLPAEGGPTPPPAPGYSAMFPPARTFVDRGRLPGGPWVELEGATLRIGTTEAADVQGVLDALRGAALTVRRVQVIRPTLEELFLQTVGARGNAPAGPPPAAAPSSNPYAAAPEGGAFR